VGCSVFGYYYFDVGNIQCAHGRPAVASAFAAPMRRRLSFPIKATAIRRDRYDQIVHAANRGEPSFFINNAIYGMTGGQMAPTTILGQKTVTTPVVVMLKTKVSRGMAEIINSRRPRCLSSACRWPVPRR
jgi:2-oxoisovalerate ferredoxin oxidoreductase beta subunit